MLYVVIGPPAGGKSTWVQEHAKPGDVVIDFDRMAVAMTGPGGDPHDHGSAVAGVTRAARNAAIETALKHTRTADVYLIHSSPGRARMDKYRAMGAEVVTVDPGRDVARQRCKSERPQRMFAVIDEWYREHGEQARVEQVSTASVAAPAYDFPSVTSRDW